MSFSTFGISTSLVNRFLKRCWLWFALLVILAAVVSSLFRALTPMATKHRSMIEQHLSLLLGHSVTIGSMETGWYWFDPVIKLNHVTLTQGSKTLMKLDKLAIGIDLFRSLWHWRIQPGVLLVDSLTLDFQQTSTGWQVVGLTNVTSDEMAVSPELLAWLLAQQKIIINRLSGHFLLSSGRNIPLQHLNIVAIKQADFYHISANALLAKRSLLQLLADVSADTPDLAKSQGHLFLSAMKLDISLWRSFFPAIPSPIRQGQGDMQIWLDWKDAQMKTIQGRVHAHQLVWQQASDSLPYLFPWLSANMAWNQSNAGWLLSIDHLKLATANHVWPDNQLQIKYVKDSNITYVYIKHLILESLLPLLKEAPLPHDLSQLLAILPHGLLDDTQVRLNAFLPDYVLTKFSHIGWQAKEAIPSMDNLSGVLYWQPSEGRLDLDSHQVLIKTIQQQSVSFPTVNGSFSWKELSHGWHVTMDHFVLKHPDLLVSASGEMDGLSATSSGQCNVVAQLSASNAQQWLSWLPAKPLKPKLYQWLTQDIKKISGLTAELKLNGRLADFPFDKQEGDFSIKGYVRDAELIFAKNWPMTQSIDAFLTVNQRLLDIDVVNADLQGVTARNGNLQIRDIGLNHETLLLHTIIDTDASKARAYVLLSPLHKKLAILQNIAMQGNIALDLNLEVPLYPENDDVLALGSLVFKHNELVVKHVLSNVALNDWNGALQFNEQGIVSSHFKAAIMNYPLMIAMQSIQKPIHSVQVTIKGKTSIDVLQKTLGWPIFSVMRGVLWFESIGSLVDKPGYLNHIQIKSSLQGTVINLPSPLGKKANESAPIRFDIDFNAEKTLNVQMIYQNLSLKLSKLVDNAWAIVLNQPDISAQLRYQPASNSLSGRFDKCHIKQQIFDNQQDNSVLSSLSVQTMPALDLRMDNVRFGNILIGDVSIKTTRQKNAWVLNSCLIKTPSYQIAAKGKWLQDNQINTTHLDATMAINDLAKSLVSWTISPVVEAQRGTIQFHGQWPGGFHNFSLAKVVGDTFIQCQNGRISHFSADTEEKLGLGKLLSILSLQTLPRRLKLDFSDLSHNGYSFDEFKGDFKITHGLMRTKNSFIDGPIAWVGMVGELDIVKQLYNLDLTVSPHVTASLPVVATIAGGPVAGIATWVVSKMINQGMQKVSAYTYTISGPWKQPVVQQISIIRHKKK